MLYCIVLYSLLYCIPSPLPINKCYNADIGIVQEYYICFCHFSEFLKFPDRQENLFTFLLND